MEIASLLPILSEIIQHPGSFFEKAILIIFAAVVFKVTVRKHFISVEDQLKALNRQISRLTGRLDEVQLIHDNHSERLTKIEKRLEEK